MVKEATSDGKFGILKFICAVYEYYKGEEKFKEFLNQNVKKELLSYRKIEDKKEDSFWTSVKNLAKDVIRKELPKSEVEFFYYLLVLWKDFKRDGAC